MLQTHPSKTLTAEARTPHPPRERCDLNTRVWLLMGDVRFLLQDDVEQIDIVRALQATLAQLLPALRDVHDNQFESGCVSDMLHTSQDSTECRLDRFATLIDTLDELSIRLDWNLPVADITPFADLRLARLIAEIRTFAHGKLQTDS